MLQASLPVSAVPPESAADAGRGRAVSGLRTFGLYAATAVVSVLLAINHLHLWGADLRLPLAYGHDACTTQMWVKTIVDNPWAFTNDYLGAPGRMEMQDFPLASNVHFLFMKGMTLFTRDPFRIVNAYYFLTFALIACSSLFLLRSLGVRPAPAVVFALAYSLIPGHFWRGSIHLMLSGYFTIPLFLCMVAWLLLDERYLFYRREGNGRLAFAWSSHKTWVTLLACAALGSDFPYYPLFGLVLGAFAAAVAVHLQRGRRVVLASGAVLGLLGCCFAANLAPTLLYRAQHGTNPSDMHVSKHPWIDGEDFGLKVVQLLLPTDHHAVRKLRLIRDEYYSKTKVLSELDAMALGTVASLGFVGLLLRLLRPDLASPRGRLYYLLGVLTVVAVLFGSVGGFGTMANLLGVRITRTYNRLSMFIACFALVGLAVWFDALLERLGRRPALRFAVYPALLGLLFVASWENSKGTYLAPREVVAAEVGSDRAYVRELEASVPAGSKVFQFPYISFLSYINVQHKMLPYDHFRCYLHSKTLRWSFGAMHARDTDRFHAHLAAFPLPKRVDALIALGFAGVHVDREGYPDKKFEAELAELLGVRPVVSPDGRFAFYPLAGRAAALEAAYPQEELSRRMTDLLETPLLGWGAGCDGEESNAEGQRWRWCRAKGSIELVNFTDHPVRRTLRFTAASYDAAGGTLRLSGPLLEDEVGITQAGVTYEREVEIPPGTHAVRFDCSARPFVHPSRTLVFVVKDYELAESPVLLGDATPSR